MAILVTFTSLLVTAITVVLVFIPAVVGQAQCNNGTIWAWNSYDISLTSPNYPRNYLSNMSCQWSIRTVDSSNVVLLKLIDFDLEGPQPDCTNDYVEIYDGSSTGSSRIQLLCGQVSNKQFTSTRSYMTVVFHSDGSNNFRGFSFSYSFQNKPVQCTSNSLVATETGKYLTSPGYPYNYPSDSRCQWSITADVSSRVVVLKLLNLYLEGVSPSCLNDYVAIYDGDISDSPRIRLLCGQVFSTQPFTSTGRLMTVVFHSNGINNYEGFKFEFTSQDKPALCGNTTLLATETAKYITSPGYPINYLSNMDCQWNITAYLSSHMVILKLLDFSLEGSAPSCNYDYVAIYDGDRSQFSRIGLLCGQVTEKQFISTGRLMTVVFHSDRSSNYKGFKFEFTSQEKSVQCTDNTLVASGTAKYITSPNYPSNYPSSTRCQWHITADALSTRVVLLKIVDFNLEGSLSSSSPCTYDNVAIYDGSSTNSPRIQLLCGQVSNTQFSSTGTSMTVVFRSDGSYNYKGFKFEYTSLEESAQCTDATLVATGTAKYITSPGYPSNYPSYTSCQWLITADWPSHIVVFKVLDLYLDGPICDFDIVALYDGDSSSSPKIQFLCGQVSNTQFTSSGPSMTVVFHSNVNTYFRGFKLEYTSLEKSALCSDVTLLANATDNYLTSPNYPNFYPSNMDCEWHITADSYSSVVVLSYSEFSLDGYQSECTSDYVKIYDGPSTYSPLIKEMCGQMYYGKFVGSKSVMTVVFHSDGGSNYYYTGFRFTYYSQEKGQKSAGLGINNTSTIVALVTSSVGVPIIVIVFAICIRRRIARRQLRNTQNTILRPREAAGRANSLFIVSLWTSNARGNPQNVGTDPSGPPPYSSLNCNVDDNLPAYTPRSPGYNMNDLPPPYSHNLPGGTAQQERSALLQETGSAHDGVGSTLEGGAHINEGFNFTNQYEVGGYMTGQNVSADVNPARDNNVVASCPPSDLWPEI